MKTLIAAPVTIGAAIWRLCTALFIFWAVGRYSRNPSITRWKAAGYTGPEWKLDGWRGTPTETQEIHQVKQGPQNRPQQKEMRTLSSTRTAYEEQLRSYRSEERAAIMRRQWCFFEEKYRCIFPLACDRDQICRANGEDMRRRSDLFNSSSYGGNDMDDEIQVLWCTVDDPETNATPFHVGHSFPATDQARNTFTQTRTEKVRTGNSYGEATYQDRQRVTDVIVYCGYHWERQNPFQKKAATPSALEANEAYNKGWEDAQATQE